MNLSGGWEIAWSKDQGMFDLVHEVREVSALNFLSKTHTWAKVGVPVNGVELKGCTWLTVVSRWFRFSRSQLRKNQLTFLLNFKRQSFSRRVGSGRSLIQWSVEKTSAVPGQGNRLWVEPKTFIYTVISYTSNYLPTGEVSSRMIHQAGHYRDSLEDLSD